MPEIMKYLMDILVGAILVGALLPTALGALLNVTLPASLSDYAIFFTLIIPLLAIFGVVAYFKNKIGK